MKILHTSDWHLGHTLYDLDRSIEQKAFLKQLAQIVQDEKPDAMVVSGDIYHTATPSAAAQRMYTDGLMKIHQANPTMAIVVTAGNHDSSSKLEVSSNLWDVVNVKTIGTFESVNDAFNYDKLIIEVKDANGHLQGYVVAVPHCYPNNFPILREDTTRDMRQTHFFQTILAEVKKRNVQQLPVVLMAHLSATGCDITGHSETVGGIEYVDIQEFGADFNYLALGHIHCPQTLKNTQERARYCGSPLPINFDENYPHSVSIVTLASGETPVIELRYIKNLKPLLTIPKEPAELEEALLQLDKNIKDDEEAYIRLNLLVKDYLALDAKEQASEVLRNKKAKLCTFKISNVYQSAADDDKPKLTLEQIQEISPMDIAQLFYEQKYGHTMSDEHVERMQIAIQQIKEEEQA